MTSLEEISTSIPVGERDADSRPTVAVRASQPSAFDALMARLFALYLPPDDSPPVPVSKPSEDKMDYFNVDSWDGSEDKECSITTKVVPDALTPANADADAGGDTLLHIYQLKMDLVEDVPTPRGSMAEHLYSCLESLNKTGIAVQTALHPTLDQTSSELFLMDVKLKMQLHYLGAHYVTHEDLCCLQRFHKGVFCQEDVDYTHVTQYLPIDELGTHTTHTTHTTPTGETSFTARTASPTVRPPQHDPASDPGSSPTSDSADSDSAEFAGSDSATYAASGAAISGTTGSTGSTGSGEAVSSAAVSSAAGSFYLDHAQWAASSGGAWMLVVPVSSEPGYGVSYDGLNSAYIGKCAREAQILAHNLRILSLSEWKSEDIAAPLSCARVGTHGSEGLLVLANNITLGGVSSIPIEPKRLKSVMKVRKAIAPTMHVHAPTNHSSSCSCVMDKSSSLLSALEKAEGASIKTLDLAKAVGCTTKKDVNHELYELEKRGLIEKTADSPPAWSLKRSGAPAPADGATSSEEATTDTDPETPSPSSPNTHAHTPAPAPAPVSVTYGDHFLEKHPQWREIIEKEKHNPSYQLMAVDQISTKSFITTLLAPLPPGVMSKEWLHKNSVFSVKTNHMQFMPEQCRPIGRLVWYNLARLLPSVAFRFQSWVLADEARSTLRDLVGNYERRNGRVDSGSRIGGGGGSGRENGDGRESGSGREREGKIGGDSGTGTADTDTGTAGTVRVPRGPSIDRILEAMTPKHALEARDSERLETLGDSFLKFAISVQLFHNEQHADEGHLTQTRSLYISNKVLCKAAFTTGMVRYMRVVPLSRGDKELEFLPPGMALPADLPHCSVWCTDIMKHPAVCGQDTDSLFERLARDTRTRPVGFKKLADFVEAVIGASYLDAGVQGGIDAIKAFGVWPKYTRAYSYTEGMPRTRKRSPEELEVYPRPFPFRSSSRSRSRSCSFTEMDAELYPNQAGASASASASASSVFVSASVSVSSASAPGFCQDTGVKRTTGDVTDAAAGDATAGDATDAEMTVEEVTVGEEFIAHEMEATHINGAGIPGIPCIAPISGISGIAPAPIPDKYKAYYDLDKLEANLEYTFNDPTLLLLALTHASISGQINNERLEFLGDAVLDLVIVAHVFRRSQSFQPEQLHKEKQLHTNNCNLARVAYQLDLERFIQHESQALSDSFVSYADALKTHKEGAVAVENKTLADAMEAVIGAMFIDSGEDMKVIEAFARCRGLIVD